MEDEEMTEIDLSDVGYPTPSSSDSSSSESVGDIGGSSSRPCSLAPGFNRFKCELTVPAGFEWCTCDLTVKECCTQVSHLLMDKVQKEREDKFVTIWSTDYLRWSCCPPGYYPEFHIGIWDRSSRQLVAFGAAVPIRIRVMQERSRIARIYFPVVRSNFRDSIPAKIVWDELIRRIRSEKIRWIVEKKPTAVPTPTALPLWKRPLNSRTLFEHGYFKNKDTNLPEIVEFYKLPLSPDIKGFKVMNGSHVEPLTGLLREYLQQFRIAPEFDEDTVKHWFLPTANLLHSYVYVGPHGNITGFFSFITIRKSRKDTELTLAFLSYNFTVGMPPQQLMKGAIIFARGIHCDIFLACEVMSNKSFLTELLFSPTRYHVPYEFDLDGIDDLTKDDIGLLLL